MILTLKEGDRVRFISAKKHEEDPEYYPPVGTEGTVEEVMPPETGLERVALVKWHMREAMNMTWFASFGMMEKVNHGKAD